MYVVRITLALCLAWGSTIAAAQCPEPVTIVRMSGEEAVERTRMRLTQCDGSVDPVALTELSVLARPLTEDPPTERSANGANVAPGIRRLDEGLLIRLQRIADEFPGREIQIVSGFRPRARATSRHRTGRALDLRVDGVSKEELCRFVHTFDETGVGYYPNSSFTHIDVRARSMHWVDSSAPGQRARYGRVDGDPFPQDDPAMGLTTSGRTAARRVTPSTVDPRPRSLERSAAVSGPSRSAQSSNGETASAPDDEERPFSADEAARVRDEIRRELARIRAQ